MATSPLWTRIGCAIDPKPNAQYYLNVDLRNTMKLFIIGAGFTKSIFSKAPLNKNLLSTVASDNRSCSQKLLDCYKCTDIEIALTKLDVDIASCNAQEKRRLREGIEKEIAIYFADFNVSQTDLDRSPWLRDLVESGFAPGDVAISLNYDCALEGALDCLGKWSPNGGYGFVRNFLASNGAFPPSPITVLKIHGSANFEIAAAHDNPDAKGVSFIFASRFFPLSARNEKNYSLIGGKNYLIAPSYVKTPVIAVAYLMIDALKASTEAKTLVIIGTSLRPEDSFLRLAIANFFRQPDWPDRQIVVVDPVAQNICSDLTKYWPSKEACKRIFPIEGLLQTSVNHLLQIIRN